MKLSKITLAFFQAVFVASVAATPVIGQTIDVEAKEWIKGRTDIPWKIYPTRTLDCVTDFAQPETAPVKTRYGSDPAHKYDATGFFRTVRENGRWWLVDPDGYRHYNTSVVGVRRGGGETNQKAFAEKYASSEQWIGQTAASLRGLGFFGTGSWSDDAAISQYNRQNPENPLARSIVLNLASGYGGEKLPVFDPGFEKHCLQKAEKILTPLANDPDILGFFSDNELPFGTKNLEEFLSAPDPGNHGRAEAEHWLSARGLTRETITEREREEFAGYVAERYFETVSRAIRQYAPNHLYLGSRLHGRAKFLRGIMEAAGKYCDVVSINYYGHWTPKAEALAQWESWAGKPFIITEFYTKGEDSGLGNVTGAGMTVRTQADRGKAYQHFTLGLLEAPGCVGWHWFRYQDNDPTNRTADPSNLDSNKGVVDNNYEIYAPLTQAMQQINDHLYLLIDFFDQRNLK